MTTLQKPAASPAVETLAGQKLPAWSLPALVVAVLAATLLLFAATGFAGTAGFVVFAVVLYLLAQSGLSFAVEGRRQAVDRLFTTLVFVAFLLAALPLLVITWYTVKAGIGVLSSD